MATAIDAEGDLIIGDAADAFQRLAIGSNTHVLTVDTSVDGKIKWAAPAGGGGMTSLASGSIAASSTGFDLQSISGAYNELWLYIKGFSVDTGSATLGLRFNNDSATNYAYQNFYIQSGTIESNDFQTSARITRPLTASVTTASAIVRLPNYADTTSLKIGSMLSTPANNSCTNGWFQWNDASAINRISVIASSGNFDGGTYELFGVK